MGGKPIFPSVYFRHFFIFRIISFERFYSIYLNYQFYFRDPFHKLQYCRCCFRYKNDINLCFKWKIQKRPPQVFCKKSCSYKFRNIQACHFIKKGIQHMIFPVNIAECLRKPILNSICERLLLDIQILELFQTLTSVQQGAYFDTRTNLEKSLI